MLATLDKEDWEALSALGTWFGAAITFLAVLVALFGEQLRRWLMRPKLSVSCGLSGLLFQCYRGDGGEAFHVRLSVINRGKESAKNVQCVLEAIRIWNGSEWLPRDWHLPYRLKWSVSESNTLAILAPESSSFLKLGSFFGNNGRPVLEFGEDSLRAGRYEMEIILTSDDHLHYHGFFEISWSAPDEGLSAKTFAIKESRRITSD